MARRKTHEEFLEELNKINPNIEALEKYQGQKIKIKCRCKVCGREWEAFPGGLLQGSRCPSCVIKSKTKTHEEFIKELNEINPNIEILGKYQNGRTKIRCRCKVCGYEWEPLPCNLIQGGGCRQCVIDKLRKKLRKSQEVFEEEVKNINENIVVLEKYVNIRTGVLVQCKLCNSKFKIYPKSIHELKNIFCPVCSDGISYPNKYIRNFLKQLPISNLTYEWHPEWAKQYSYDNYFVYNNNEYIIEADGAQHFSQKNFSKFNTNDVQERDRIKNELANNNNIIMIRIDCQKSNSDYIKGKILESELSSIFDLSGIDWDFCHKQSLNSLVKQVCDLYNDGYKNMGIVHKLKINKNTVRRYLQLGNELGWCNYVIIKDKEVNVYDKSNLKLLYSFTNLSNCVNFLNDKYKTEFDRNTIISVCKGRKKSYRGFIFKYV